MNYINLELLLIKRFNNNNTNLEFKKIQFNLWYGTENVLIIGFLICAKINSI